LAARRTIIELYGDMIPRERGIKGIIIFIIFYSPMLEFIGKRGYMSF
jgi:hypothetical protein